MLAKGVEEAAESYEGEEIPLVDVCEVEEDLDLVWVTDVDRVRVEDVVAAELVTVDGPANTDDFAGGSVILSSV